jgi:23S rRNA (cytidine2498-2'-O)-methyltransferase
MHGYEPGSTELTTEIGQLFKAKLCGSKIGINVNNPCELGAKILDVVLVEPDHWIIGYHIASHVSQCWPGGTYPVATPNPMVSRAYLKMAESIAWAGFPMEVGDAIVELGSAPGGSCQRLLDLGLAVTGIDPAPMAPLLMSHPRFEHWRGKSSTIKRRRYAKFRWLAADANVAPNYTLDCVEDIVTYKTSQIEGLLLTLKLSSYDLADHMSQYLERVRSWGYDQISVRQLATNRRECCLAAYRSP